MSSVDTAIAPALGLPVTVRRRAALAYQFRNELALVFRRRRNIAMLIVLAAVPLLIGTAVKLSSPHGGGGGPAFISQLTDNGLFLAFAALTVCLPVFLPLAIAVVCGDAIAGEANIGTLRYLLTVPVSRTRVLVVKSLGALSYLAAAVVVVAVVGIVAGLALFGSHGVTLLSGNTVSFANGLERALGVAVFVFVDLLGLAALAIFLSTLTEVPIGAMAGTVAFVIAFAVLDSVPQLGSIRGMLLTHHWLGFGDLLRSQYSLASLAHQLVVPLAYTAIFFTAAWARITTADITS
ncbi:MAG: ABC transporter permease [Acidothermaceae bacterium]